MHNHTMPGWKERRQRALADVIRSGVLASQEELAERLGTRGFGVTQATISRDLEQIGAVKVRRNGQLTTRSRKMPEATRIQASQPSFATGFVRLTSPITSSSSKPPLAPPISLASSSTNLTCRRSSARSAATTPSSSLAAAPRKRKASASSLKASYIDRKFGGTQSARVSGGGASGRSFNRGVSCARRRT